MSTLNAIKQSAFRKTLNCWTCLVGRLELKVNLGGTVSERLPLFFNFINVVTLTYGLSIGHTTISLIVVLANSKPAMSSQCIGGP